MAEEKFGELLAAVRKAQADVMLFLEEKEQAALNQVNGIKTHLEYRSVEMEKSKQELEKLAAISNTVLFLEVQRLGKRETPGASGLRHVFSGESGLDSSESSDTGGIRRMLRVGKSLEGGSSSRRCICLEETAVCKDRGV